MEIQHLIYKANRLFDSPVQQNRPPIKDMDAFRMLQQEFFMAYMPAFKNVRNGIVDNVNFEASLLAADKLIEMEPQRAIPWTYRGLALMGLGRATEALEANSQAIEIDPSDPEKWRSHTTILKLLGRDQEAKEAENMALKLSEKAT